MTEMPPGTRRDPELAARLESAWAAKGPDYAPRTHLLDASGRARFVNRLILEPSPYLLQHAHNPVDWRAWNAETLAAAKALDRPIFVSVGYATCHWCHVMEEESFDNEDVAAALNAGFVPVKIDREERPDLDHIFITATQLQQGHAGWPNSVWLLPDGRPFHTGTYFPQPHFLAVLGAVLGAWAERRAEVVKVADQIGQAIARQGPQPGTAPADLPEGVYGAVSSQLAQMFNAEEGGFSQGQQFPQEGFILYLLDHWRRSGDSLARRMALASLDAIEAGGIHDHAGGGFHRYTVDPDWRTPHFEKMLYNQGLLARAFVEAWEDTGAARYRRAAERCFDYVARDMTDPDGAFYAAEDADSVDPTGARAEGAFYVWTADSFAEALGPQAGAAAAPLGMETAPTLEGANVIHFPRSGAVDREALSPALETLRQARDARPRPVRDEKLIAGWNGLMIRALADGAAAFDRPDLATRAMRAAETLWTRHWQGRDAGAPGVLMRLWSPGGGAREPGMLEDYAWAGLAFTALADATGEALWLGRAEMLADAARARLAHPSGRLRMAEADAPTGPVFDASDGATPSGESAMAELLARLAIRRPGARTQGDHAGAARALIGALSPALARMPLLRPDALTARRLLDAGESGARQVLAGGAVLARLTDRRITLTIAPGWHVNAAEPGTDAVVAATIDGASALWPDGRVLDAASAPSPVAVYEGRLVLPLSDPGPVVSLTVQPCSGTLCLAPVTARFRLG